MQIKFRACLALSLVVTTAPLLAAQAIEGGCEVFPTNHSWNTPFDRLPVSGVNSANWVNMVWVNQQLQADWGNKRYDGGQPPMNDIVFYGIPFSRSPSERAPCSQMPSALSSHPPTTN